MRYTAFGRYFRAKGYTMFHFKNAALAALLSMAVAAPAAALDRRVTIVNNTGYTIVNFFGSNTGTNSWEEDILGRDVLPSGSSVVINFNDGTGYCMFDFLAIFDDGEQLIRERVNICEISTFTYN